MLFLYVVALTNKFRCMEISAMTIKAFNSISIQIKWFLLLFVLTMPSVIFPSCFFLVFESSHWMVRTIMHILLLTLTSQTASLYLWTTRKSNQTKQLTSSELCLQCVCTTFPHVLYWRQRLSFLHDDSSWINGESCRAEATWWVIRALCSNDSCMYGMWLEGIACPTLKSQ